MGPFFVDLGQTLPKVDLQNGEPTADELKKINKLNANGPIRKLNAEDVLVRKIGILGTEPTTKLSIHPEGKLNGKTIKNLTTLKKLLPGTPMMEGHRKDKIPWGRVFDATIEEAPGYEGGLLVAHYYFVNDQEGQKRLKNIDAGIYAEGSISYWFHKARCSICHEEMMGSGLFSLPRCKHQPGEKDEKTGQIAYWYPDEIERCAEISHVYRGAYGKTKTMLAAGGGMEVGYSEDEIQAAQKLEQLLEAQKGEDNDRERKSEKTGGESQEGTGETGETEKEGQESRGESTPGSDVPDDGGNEDARDNEGGGDSQSGDEGSGEEDQQEKEAGTEGQSGEGEEGGENGGEEEEGEKGGDEGENGGDEGGERSNRGPGNRDTEDGNHGKVENHSNKNRTSKGTAPGKNQKCGQLVDNLWITQENITSLNGTNGTIGANIDTNTETSGGEEGRKNATPANFAGCEGQAGTVELTAEEREQVEGLTGEGLDQSEVEDALYEMFGWEAEDKIDAALKVIGEKQKPEEPTPLAMAVTCSDCGWENEHDSTACALCDASLERGDGQGKGGKRQGDGGAAVCVCPKCGHEQKHEKGVPCAKMKCEKCGTTMEGKNKTGYCDACGREFVVDRRYDSEVCAECGQAAVVYENLAQPMKAVGPVKPAKAGMVNNEFFRMEDFDGLPSGTYHIEPKYDGVWIEAHKKGGRVKLMTDEKNDVTDHFPGVVKELNDMKPDSFILAGEMVKYRGRQRLGHDTVTAWIHTEQEKYDDKHFRYKPYTAVYMKGRDLQDVDLGTRRRILDKNVPWGKQVHRTKQKSVTHKSGKSKIVAAIKDRMTREGAMVKNVEATYNRKGRKLLYKYKRQFEVDAKVTRIQEKKGGGFVYTCEVGRGKEAEKIGETFATKIKAAVDDIITVSVDKVTLDEKSGKYSWFAPKVLKRRPDKKQPDPISTIRRIAVKKGEGEGENSNVVTLGEVLPKLMRADIPGAELWLIGSIVEHGIAVNDFDVLVRRELTAMEKDKVVGALGERLSKMMDLTVDEEGPAGPHVRVEACMTEEELKAWKHAKSFVLQEHGWGKKTHWDLRFGAPKTPRMWGWTLFSKPSMEAGGKKVRCQEKKYHDPKWMDVNTKTIKPGEPGNPTKNQNAYMVIVDSGKYEYIRRKPGFLEVVLHGKKWKGRYLFREIKVKQADKMMSDCKVDGDEVGPKNEKIWIMWKPEKQETKEPVNKFAYAKNPGGAVYFWETSELDFDIEDAADEKVEEGTAYEEME